MRLLLLSKESAYSWSIVQLMISFWTSFQAYAYHTYRFLVQEFLKIKVRKEKQLQQLALTWLEGNSPVPIARRTKTRFSFLPLTSTDSYLKKETR